MGRKIAEEKKREEKIKSYQQIVDTAFILFDGKYTIDQISKQLPYKKLIAEIEREQEISKEYKDIKAARKLEKTLY